MLERCASGISEDFIEHIHSHATDRFIVNMHSFDNPHLLRAAIPRSLSAPQSLHINRTEKHAAFSANLRRTQNAKREAQRKKRAAEKARKAGLQKDVTINAGTHQEHPSAHCGDCDGPVGAPSKQKRVD